MSIVEVGSKYRVTITQEVRKKVPVRVGQRVCLLALAKLIGDITYSREERKRAEENLLKEAV